MRILILGGTGNISLGMVPVFLKEGHEVVLINRGSKKVKGAVNLVCDRRNYAEFEALVAGLGTFDCVYDMIGFSLEDAKSDIRAFGGRTKQFVFCSTVDVYQKPAPFYPVKESTPKKADKRFEYSYYKLEMEKLLEAAAAEGRFELTIVRPAATYCDESAPIGIYNNGYAVLRRIREGKPILVLGDGMSLWTFSHRDDVGAAIARAAGNEKTYGKAYHVCGDKAIPWISYYRTLAKAMGVKEVEFVHIPTDVLFAAEPADCSWCEFVFQYDNIYDTTAAKTDLGYKTTITWEEGAKKMTARAEKAGHISSSTDSQYYDFYINTAIEWKKFLRSR